MSPNEWKNKESYSWEDLETIVDILRGPDGCEWDKIQTHQSLRNLLVEESYEVCEGIDREDDTLLCEELGDVLLQICFHIGIARDRGVFGRKEVLQGICEKMIRRHPHIFSENACDVPDWEEIKRREKGERSLFDTLNRISTSLPALKRGEKFYRKGAPLPKESSLENATLRYGAKLYEICRHCCDEGIDPEEALNAYLKESLATCTNLK